jgi:hypothetical protein
MIGRSRRVGVAVLLVAVMGIGVFQYWKRGRAYGEPDWSPNRQFYIRRYVNWTPAMYMMRPPGDGGTYDGYVRLFDRRGRLLHERYYQSNSYVQSVWSGREVWLMAGVDEDDGPWTLPASSE